MGIGANMGIGAELRFASRMAVREARTTWRLLALLALAIACGTGALVATETVTGRLRSRVDEDARAAMGGDLDVSSIRPLPSSMRARIASVVRTGATTVGVVETLSMASTPATSGVAMATRLVSVRAVGPGYPLRGALLSDPPGARERFERGEGFLVSKALLTQMGVGRGTVLTIGSFQAPILGTLTGEPDQISEGFRLGPRVMMTLADLERARLIRRGSRARHRVVLALPAGVDPRTVAHALVADLQDPGVDVRTATDGQPALARFIRNLSMFLDLVGLTVMLLAGIGAAASIQALLQHRRPTLAILRCVGASGRLLVLTYLVQVVALALAGSAIGAAAGILGQQALAGALLGRGAATALVPGSGGLGMTALAAAVRGTLVGLVVALGLALVPLLAARRVSPMALLVPEGLIRSSAGRFDPLQWITALVVAGALVALAASRAASIEMASVFLVGLAGTGAALMLASRAILVLAARFPVVRSFPWRHALRRLGRPGHSTGATLAAVGLSVFLVMTVHRVDDLLATELVEGLGPRAPNVFVVDVQEDQRSAVLATMTRHGATGIEAAPLVRSRLAAIDGHSIRTLYPDAATAPWFISREYVLTYRDAPSDHEVVVKGRFWAPGDPGRDEVSIEKATAQRLGIDLGSTLTLDLEGGPVTLTVTSIRAVKWTSLRPNFFMILPPHVLEGKSKTFFAVGHVRGAQSRAELQRELVRAMPNLMVVDLTDALALVRGFAGRIGTVIALAGALCMLAGALVLAAAVTLTRAQRAREGAILKAQGATRATLLAAMTIESMLVGLVGGFVGGVGAHLLARELLIRLFDLVLDGSWWPIVAGALVAGLFTSIAGVLASRGLLGRPPLAILREP